MQIATTYKCEKCNEEFVINKNSYTNCPNNCCSVKIGTGGEEVKYISGNPNCYRIVGEKIFRNPSNYIIPNKKCEDIVSFLIKQRKELNNYILNISYDKCITGKRYLRNIYVTIYSGNNSGINYFKSSIYFLKDNKKTNINDLYNKLLRLKNFILDVKSNKINISIENRNSLTNMFNCEQKGLYDYRFNIDDILED